jgi:hypothetical protein
MPPYMSPRRATRLSLGLLVVVLTACGGGGGGGGGGSATGSIVHLLVVNKSADPATITYTGAEAAPDDSVDSCKAVLADYPLANPFTVAINGTVSFDSATLPDGLPNGGEGDMVLKITINSDGTVEFDDPAPGRRISPPGTTAICPTLPG